MPSRTLKSSSLSKKAIISISKTAKPSHCLLLIALVCIVIIQTSRHHHVDSLRPASIDRRPGQGNQPNSQACLSRATELDRCLPKLVVYGDRQFDYPKTDEQLDKHCLTLDDNLKCVSSYSRECLPSFARNLYSVVVRRLKTQFSKRCKSKEGRRDFMNLMVCGEPQIMEPSHRCMDAFIAHLEHIGRGGTNGSASQSRQIELTCCTFQLFTECIFGASKRLQCPKRVVSADKSIEYVKTIINSMGGDMMDFMCGKYDTVAACKSGYPAIMNEFKQITAKVANGTLKPESASPLKPMLQLFIDQQQELD